jgi:hypothetical protein
MVFWDNPSFALTALRDALTTLLARR